MSERVEKNTALDSDHAELNQLWKAVTVVRDLATSLQNPVRHSPYGSLGMEVAAQATEILALIRNYNPAEPVVIVDDND